MPGDTATPLGLLLEHDRWATRRLLHFCTELTPAQFEQRFDMGLGNLRDTLTHIVSAMCRWNDRIAAVELRPSLEGTAQSPQQLLALHDEAAETLAATARRVLAESRFEEMMEVEFKLDSGETERFTFTRGMAIMHVLTHGTHHRAQCIWMLRRLRPDLDLPDFDLIESQIMPGDD